MCDLITNPTHSIIKQSYNSQERIGKDPLNGDGFGIGWYITHDHPKNGKDCEKMDVQTPCVFLSVTPAWNNLNLIRLAEKIRSPLFFGHVRAASPGILTTETNCHPFLFGHFMWMHNGNISDFHLIKRRLTSLLTDELFLQIQGTTDSEAIFMLFLNILQSKYPKSSLKTLAVDPYVLKSVMEETIHTLMKWKDELQTTSNPYHMNFAVSDGKSVIVTRCSYPCSDEAVSLYYASGTQFTIGENNDYEMLQTDRRQTCHIIASEPLSASLKDWIPVPREHLIMVTSDSSLLMFPLSKAEPEKI
jgi:predicted glutamine amidotransferase